MAYPSCQVFLLPVAPFDPAGKPAFGQAKLLVVDDPLPSSPRARGAGDVAHLVEKHSGDRYPGNIQPVVGSGEGDQVARTVGGSQFLVRGEAPDPRGPSNHRLQPSLEMRQVQLREQILEIQGLAPRTTRRNLVRHLGSHPCEDPPLDVLAALARPRKRVQGKPDPVPEIDLDLRGGGAQRLGNLANPNSPLLHQSPPLPSAGGEHQRNPGILRGVRCWSALARIGTHRCGLVPEQIQDELDGGSDHRIRPPSPRSRHLRTGAKVRRWRALGPNRTRASRWPGVG